MGRGRQQAVDERACRVQDQLSVVADDQVEGTLVAGGRNLRGEQAAGEVAADDDDVPLVYERVVVWQFATADVPA